MKKLFFVMCASLTVVLFNASISPADDEELKDTPYFSSMPNYYVGEATDREFDAFGFFDGKNSVNVEGKFWKRDYSLKEDAKQASELQILRNYAGAVRKMGGKVLIEGQCSDCDASTCSGNIMTGQVTKGSANLWVQVIPCNGGSTYSLVVVEKEAMKQDVTASDLLDTLNSQGSVAVYINFDIDKSTIKSDSRPVIEQIVKLLQDNSDLKVRIDGHTDNTGTPARNKTLSTQRAQAVMDVLVKEGIGAKRLSAKGWGQEKPLADNGTEEGRAKNRRVEIVKQ